MKLVSLYLKSALPAAASHSSAGQTKKLLRVTVTAVRGLGLRLNQHTPLHSLRGPDANNI